MPFIISLFLKWNYIIFWNFILILKWKKNREYKNIKISLNKNNNNNLFLKTGVANLKSYSSWKDIKNLIQDTFGLKIVCFIRNDIVMNYLNLMKIRLKKWESFKRLKFQKQKCSLIELNKKIAP